MEIDKAIRGSDDRSLKTKYNNAVYLIRRALALYSIEELAFSFNGGKDSTVLLHLLRAGYYLHNEEKPLSNGRVTWHENTCPVRVIYFESPSSFPEIDAFTHEMAKTYGLHMDIIKMDFKSGLETLLMSIPVRAIFLGVRIGDPAAVGQEQFSPSSPGWPPFMRVNPILDWSYRDVWSFLLTCKVQYCLLYDRGYTSIGNVYDTVPNALLCVEDGSGSGKRFSPAYLLLDGRSERAGRTKKTGSAQPMPESFPPSNAAEGKTLTCSVIAVGDEILSGTVYDELGKSLCRKIHSIGWVVSRMTIVPNEIDCVAQEIEAQKSLNTMVYIYGGVGPFHSDVTAAAVAKAFGAHCCTGDRNELPEGITELLHHEKLAVPLIKCENVILLMSTNVAELNVEWSCLMEIAEEALRAAQED